MAHRIIRTEADRARWHPFPGYEGLYEIAANGRVRSLPRTVNSPACAGGVRRIKGKELTLQSIKGYPGFLARGLDGRKTTAYIHRAIAILFVPNPDNKPNVNHIDGNKENFDPTNLEWVTHAENMRHAFETGLTPVPTSGPGEASPAAKLTWDAVRQIRLALETGRTHASVAADHGVSKGTIGMIARNETWRI